MRRTSARPVPLRLFVGSSECTPLAFVLNLWRDCNVGSLLKLGHIDLRLLDINPQQVGRVGKRFEPHRLKRGGSASARRAFKCTNEVAPGKAIVPIDAS